MKIEKSPGFGENTISGCFFIPRSLYRCGFIQGENLKPGPALDSQNVGLVKDYEGSKRLSAGWLELGSEFEHFVGGRNTSGNAPVLDAGQVLAHS